MKFKIERVVRFVLCHFKYAVMFATIAGIAILVFASTFGPLSLLDKSMEYADGSAFWERVISPFLFVGYVVLNLIVLYKMERPGDDPLFVLSNFMFIMLLPMLAMLACGFGLICWGIISWLAGDYWNDSVLNIHHWKLALMIMGFYAGVGFVTDVVRFCVRFFQSKKMT